MDEAIAFGVLSAITLATVANLQIVARSSWRAPRAPVGRLAALFGCVVGLCGAEARADCPSRGAEVVVPGTFQRAAPKNTHVFVTSTNTKLQGAELRQKDDQALVPSRATLRVDAENGSRFIELLPDALLEPGKAYEVHGVLASGSKKLAAFRVVDVLDQKPPRFGEAALTLSRGGGYVQLDALVDDTTADDDLRLLLWQGEQDPRKPGAPPPLADLLPERFSAGQAKYFLAGRDDECNSRWHTYSETKAGTVFTLALIDHAGKVSAPRIVKLAEQRLLRDDEPKVSLYYVPGAQLLLQARTLWIGAAAALLAVLALVFAWRSRQKRRAA